MILLIKKTKAILLSSFATVILISGVAITDANAANTKDTKFDFVLGKFGGNDYSSAREKQNKTATYVKLTSIGKGKMNAWILKSNGASVRSPKTIVKMGEEKFLTNYAYEDYGVCDVKLAGETEKVEFVTLSAVDVWSPDSVR